jgi:hypothetical protein
VVKFLLDLCLYWLFIKDFLYFFRQKRAKTGHVTRFNYLILALVFALMLFSFAHSVFALVAEFLNFTDEQVRYYDRNILPGKDFLISCAMLYLFYYQASRAASVKVSKAKKNKKYLPSTNHLMPYDELAGDHLKENERRGRRKNSDTDSCDTERVKSFLTFNKNKQGSSP